MRVLHSLEFSDMKNNLQSSILVAVDMGSHSFRAMAAERMPSGSLRVLGVEESSQKCCVREGVVDNTSDAGYMLNSIIKLLGNRIRTEVCDGVFVCLGGRTMKVVSVCSSRDLVHKRDIDSLLLAKMETECKDKIENKHPGVIVLDLIPCYYKLDGHEQDYIPTSDQRATFIEAHFNAFVGKTELFEKVQKTFQRTTLNLEKMYVRPEALMNAVASEEDMEKGCAVLDFGAQTTTLTIYKGGEYLYNQVVTMGGLDVTESIENLGISLPLAERLKCMYGVATAEKVKMDRRYVLTTMQGDKVAIGSIQLANTISAKLDEIVSPLIETLNKEAHRLKVLYLTGGGSMLQGLVEYIQSKTSLKVMYGSHAAWLTPDTPDEYCMPQYASLVGTLLLAAEYSETHPPVKKYSKNKPIIDRIKDKTLELFSQTEY